LLIEPVYQKINCINNKPDQTAMTPLQERKLQTYHHLCVFFSRNFGYLKKNPLNKVTGKFRMRTMTLAILVQHEGIIRTGIERDIPAMKGALCNLAHEFATVLHGVNALNVRGDRPFLKPRPAGKLMQLRDDQLIRYCRDVHHVADSSRKKLYRLGIEHQAIHTLKSATEMYNAVVPPPRSAVLIAEQYGRELNKLFKKLDDTLTREIDRLVQEYSKINIAVFEQYTAILKNGETIE
jgi:hypothetical protein